MEKKNLISLVDSILYDKAYLELTEEQLEEFVGSFDEKSLELLKLGSSRRENVMLLVLNQLSKFLIKEEWPYYVDSDAERNARWLQLEVAIQNKGYKIRR